MMKAYKLRKVINNRRVTPLHSPPPDCGYHVTTLDSFLITVVKRAVDNLTVALRAWTNMSSYESKSLEEIVHEGDVVDYDSDIVTREEEGSEPDN